MLGAVQRNSFWGVLVSNAHGSRVHWNQRCGPSGLHLFERVSGWNILLDEMTFPTEIWSLAPRQVSIALTNECDLACSHCYAPKSRGELSHEFVTALIKELGSNGCFGVSFGGGEPTLHPRFTDLCRYAAEETRLAVTFTTHGHSISERLADELRGNVHFVRVSMDGVGSTYEAIRRRSFSSLKFQLELIRSISRMGINFVVNDRTLPDLDEASVVAEDLGASEFLLLPQIPVNGIGGIDDRTNCALLEWVDRYCGSLVLTISEDSSKDFPICDPLALESGLRGYAHIDACGFLKSSSFHSAGERIDHKGVMSALARLSCRKSEVPNEDLESARL